MESLLWMSKCDGCEDLEVRGSDNSNSFVVHENECASMTYSLASCLHTTPSRSRALYVSYK